MVKITLPFTPEMERAAARGDKICTTRLERKGEPGCFFYLDTGVYFLNDVIDLPLKIIAEKFYRLEGFNSPEEFIAFWDGLDGYPPHADVWMHQFPVHFFNYLGEVGDDN